MESDFTLPPEGVSTPTLTSLFQTTDATPVRGVAHAYTSTPATAENTLAALITSFIPDSWCHDRYWILEDAGTTTISSGGPDRLYSPCMPVRAAT
ncbi:hypothetical protein PG993_000213 [Apiospora rasikravindrae]|uniref:Uncharacterized protein n=1 Tax=Apiospora rasikravindrae TaxID=990691 RepID=A0ABR1U7V2_9PEZI